jgi:tetratricopeptide (TPR) repeat protein
MPVVNRKIEQHFSKAIELAEEVGAKGVLGRAYLDFGIYHQTKKRTDQARECISRAIALFDECKADGYLKQAREVMAALTDEKD